MSIFMRSLCPFSGTKKLALVLTFSLIVIICLMSSASFADEDPFQFENTHWMSFDRYKEKIKTGVVLPSEPQKNTEEEKDTSSGTSDTKDDSGAAITPPTMTPEVAAPTRAINTPVMPGVNKGFQLDVKSTEDAKPVAQITNIETAPAVTLPASNWQTPKEAAQHLGDDDSDGADREHQPLDVRMSFLPNKHIAPIPSPEYNSNHGRKTPAVATASVEPQKKAADLAACAAVDSYKKKQLQAIESDRQTLADLQKAIASLGLQKELSFLTGANGSVNQADSSTAKMDMPPSLAAPAKN